MISILLLWKEYTLLSSKALTRRQRDTPFHAGPGMPATTGSVSVLNHTNRMERTFETMDSIVAKCALQSATIVDDQRMRPDQFLSQFLRLHPYILAP